MKYTFILALFGCLLSGVFAVTTEEAVHNNEAPNNIQLRGNRNLSGVLASWGQFKCGKVGTGSSIVLNLSQAVRCTVTILWGDGVKDVSSLRSYGAKSVTIYHKYPAGTYCPKFNAKCRTPASATGSSSVYEAAVQPVTDTKFSASSCELVTFYDFLNIAELNSERGFDEGEFSTSDPLVPGTLPSDWETSP